MNQSFFEYIPDEEVEVVPRGRARPQTVGRKVPPRRSGFRPPLSFPRQPILRNPVFRNPRTRLPFPRFPRFPWPIPRRLVGIPYPLLPLPWPPTPPSQPPTPPESPASGGAQGSAAPAGEPASLAPQGNEFIRWVQSTLNQVLSLNLPVDGILGSETRSAVRSFQERMKLTPDGIVGPETRQALLQARQSPTVGDTPSVAEPPSAPPTVPPQTPPLSGGEPAGELWEGEVNRNSSDYIRWVQTALNRILSLSLAIDGIAGSMTRSAVRTFQSRNRLTVDGIVGPQTEQALINAGAGQPPQVSVSPGTGAGSAINSPLPQSGPGFTSYVSADRRYGLSQTIQALRAIAQGWQQAHLNGPRLGIGDLSFRGGGKMSPHVSHQNGLDVDIRPKRSDGRETSVSYQDSGYSRNLTQELVNRIINNGVLRVQYIFFNDSAVTGVRPWQGHDNHLHVRFYTPSGSTPAASPATVQPSTTPTTPTSLQTLRQNIVNVALQELQRWGNGSIKETNTAIRPILENYWRTGVGYLPTQANWWSAVPWSAAFTSFVMRQAGAGSQFRYSGGHSYYIVAAKQNRLSNNSNPFKAYRINEVTPQPGDLVCKSRDGSGATYDNIQEGMSTHCDVVTGVQSGNLTTVGGNVSDSVRVTNVPTDANGHISAPDYFAVIHLSP